MRVVVAHSSDAGAVALVERWQAEGHAAGLLTVADLSAPGWVHDPERPALGSAVVGGRALRVSELSGVVTRLMTVVPLELPWIHEEDREYAAQEMHAFLLAWLTDLPCLVINRPTPGCLAGPAWGPEEWVRRAFDAGMLGREIVRGSRGIASSADAPDAAPARATVAVEVVRERAFIAGKAPSALDQPLADVALALARGAGAELLHVELETGPDEAPRVVSAGPWLDVFPERVACAVGDLFPVSPRAQNAAQPMARVTHWENAP